MEIDPISLPDLQRLLPPETSLVSYFLLPAKALAWVVHRQGFQMVDLPL